MSAVRRAGSPRWTRASPNCWSTAMDERLEELVSSLLYEGYALYPYTPEATKNATPTPFGIVYPPADAGEGAGPHDHVRVECGARPASDGTVTATPRYLAP